MIQRGDAVARDPSGRLASITRKTLDHWDDKPAERIYRLSRMRQALAAVQEPQEVWERNGRRYYFKSFEDGKRTRSMLVAVGDDGDVKTWVPVDHAPKYADRNRTGVLHYKEGA